MSRRKFDLNNEKVRIALNVLKIAGALALIVFFPNALLLLAPRRRKLYSEQDFRRTAYYLKRRGDIRFVTRQGKKYIELTRQGLNRLEKIENFHRRELKHRPEAWDGKWRIIIFDIPESERVLRDALRRKLREYDCAHLQKSVWVSPYEIRDDIRALRKEGGFKQVSIQCILADSFDDEFHFRRIFSLKKKH
jgi:DNA-binding transcriptional regulator PaaX